MEQRSVFVAVGNICSDASTQILLDDTLQSKSTELHHKISIVKDNMKVELETKCSVSPSGNILCLSSLTKTWLDLVENLCLK